MIEDCTEKSTMCTHGFSVNEPLVLYDEIEDSWGGLPKYTCK